MKTQKKIVFAILLQTLFLMLMHPVFGSNDETYITIHGSIKDAKTNKPLFFAYVSLPDLHVGTVSNSEGDYIFKINSSLNAQEVEFSHLGYISKRIPIADLTHSDVEVYLEPSSLPLPELTIRPLDAAQILADALAKISKNYSSNPNMLTGFYRETIKQRREYISISEAVLDIYKAPYKRHTSTDRVRIYKGRKSSNVKKADTLAVKLQGGPKTTLLLDVAKNPDILFFEDYDLYYDFNVEDIVTLDNEINYVISFTQKPEVIIPLYEGRLYINSNNLAITNAQFSLNLTDGKEAAKVFLLKKPRGVKFVPTSTSYYVTFTEHNGTYYLSYARNELSFKANWNQRLFSTNYTVMSELAITDRDTEEIPRIPFKETFKSSHVLSDAVEAFNDVDFWGEHNYIKPEESIEKAIKKYGKRLKRQSGHN